MDFEEPFRWLLNLSGKIKHFYIINPFLRLRARRLLPYGYCSLGTQELSLLCAGWQWCSAREERRSCGVRSESA